jgi:hypothetical protein
MSVKIALSILSFLSLCGIVLFSTSGCKQTLTERSPDTALATVKPAIPLLDKESHKSVETAYFALG